MLGIYLVKYIVAFGVRSYRWLSPTVTGAATCAAVMPVTFALLREHLPFYMLGLGLGCWRCWAWPATGCSRRCCSTGSPSSHSWWWRSR
ncbi:hypothetical protein [Actinomadura kijaniata]|uniref:hypothetical protein n=1 Tax=Actinomadura kijaniata TaxID=46161 RepID=UPI00082CC16C|nr:hypothetical protein [Actinomadura kijaniata]